MSKKLLILDLDETLLHSSESAPANELATYRIGEFFTQFRPFLPEFLQNAAETFLLAIWTAASAPYAREALAHLTAHTGLKPEWAFIFTRERCTPPPRWDPERAPLKDLQKAFRRGYRRESTMMLDDRPDGLRRHRGNHIPITPWRGNPNDAELPRIWPELQRLNAAENIRAARGARHA